MKLCELFVSCYCSLVHQKLLFQNLAISDNSLKGCDEISPNGLLNCVAQFLQSVEELERLKKQLEDIQEERIRLVQKGLW